MAPASRSSRIEAAGRLLSGLAVLILVVAAASLLLPSPLSDAFFAVWVLGGVAVSVVGAFAAWTNRTPLVWLTALLLLALSVLGMWSIGFLVAPAALCLLGSAVLLRRAGPREEVRNAVLDDPPSVSEAVAKTLVGAGAVVVGAGLVYTGSLTRQLFGACARETLACAVEKTHWDAVAVTLAGLVVVSVGCWLLWTQIYAARVLSTEHVR